jgi:hypothetical protein
MKKIFCLGILLTIVFSVSAKSISSTEKTLTTIVPQKTKHPTEAMTNEQANAILNAMRQKRTDAEKVQVLKDGVKDKGITVDQLIKLLNQFLTDDSKLESAEYAFPYTVNYKAYLKISDLFAEEKYKHILEDFYDKNKKL